MDKPFGERLCDDLVLGVAGWTILCNVAVLLGAGLDHLLVATAVALLVVFVLRRPGRRRDHGAAHGARDDAVSDATDATPARSALALGLAGAVPVLAVAWWSGATRLAWWLAVLYFGALLLLLRRSTGRAAPSAPSPRAPALIAALAVLGALLPLVAHTFSPDDGFYLNLAVSAADHPRAPLLRFDTLHGVPDLPIMYAVYRVHSLEVLGGALARLSGLSATQACHWVLPALFGAAFVLAAAALLRHVTPRTWPWSLLALLAVLVLVRGELQYPGSFSLLRLHQGKAVFVSVFAPLIVLHGLRFGAAPTRRGWLLLAAAQVAGVGATSSALWAGPLLALLALASGVRGPARRAARVLLLGLAASAYVVVAGLCVLRASGNELAGDLAEEGVKLVRLDAEPIRDGADLVRATWQTVYGTGTLSALALVATATAWAACRGERARRLCIVFPLGTLLLVFNPATALFVAERVTGGATYWRVLWALPVPLFCALLLSAPARYLPGRVLGPLLSLLLTAGFVAAASPEPFGKGIRWEFLGLKTPGPSAYGAALHLRDAVTAGSRVLAPSGVATWVVSLHDHPYPLALRPNWLGAQEARLGAVETERRRQLLRFVTGYPVANGAALLRESLARDELSGVVVYRPGINAEASRGVLRAAGFRADFENEEYEVWVRAAP